MFEEWGPLGNLAVLLVSLVILDRASDLAINNSVKVADITGFGKTIVGFLLMASFTTLPELSVSIFAAIEEKGIGIAIGNVLGSNIANICLILGVGFIVASARNTNHLKMVPLLAKEEVGTLYFGLFIASIVPLTLLYIGYASKLIGALLIGIFIAYIFQLSRTRHFKNESCVGEERARLKLYLFLTFLGAVIVVASAHFIVESASYIAEWFGVPQVILGATIVAFGTSLPEFVNSVKSSARGHLNLALGNIIGSCFTNITLILGVALLGIPLRVNMAAFSSLVMFSLITNLLLWYFLSGENASWREGTLLICMYVVFLVTSFGGGYRATV